MSDTVKPKDLHERFRAMAEATARHTFFEDPFFENVTVKEAKAKAAAMESYTMRFAMDYHSSMLISEQEERHEALKGE